MAYTPAYRVNDTLDKILHQPAFTSLRSLLVGSGPRTQGVGLKAAYVKLTFTSGDVYTTAGVVANLLGQLPGWTEILSTISDPYNNPNATAALERAVFFAQNDATASNRKMLLTTLNTGVEVANSRVLTDVTIEVLVLGY